MRAESVSQYREKKVFCRYKGGGAPRAPPKSATVKKWLGPATTRDLVSFHFDNMI